jgi:HSP20 family protein
MDRLLSNFTTAAGEVGWPLIRSVQPALNAWEAGDALRVELEVPGVKQEQLDISVVGNELTIKVERTPAVPEGATYHRQERPVGAFTRVLRLPVEVDAGRVEAELRHGVLTITLPKAETARPRKIQVTTAGPV